MLTHMVTPSTHLPSSTWFSSLAPVESLPGPLPSSQLLGAGACGPTDEPGTRWSPPLWSSLPLGTCDTLLCLFDHSFLASFVDSNFSSLSLNVGSPQDTVLNLLVLFPYRHWVGFSGGSVVKNLLTKQGTQVLSLGLGRFPWRRKWQPTAIFLPGSHGQRSLVDCSPWGRRVRHDLVTQQQLTKREHFVLTSWFCYHGLMIRQVQQKS